MALPVVGLTGGIASGKSSVAAALGHLGIPVVDADALAREVVAPGTAGLAEIAATFGQAMITPEGTLDRPALAAVVFEDPEARTRLEAITHPRIAQLASERMAALQDSDAPYLVYEAALLVESGSHRFMQAIVVVSLDEDTQQRRLEQRDGLSPEQARARISSQAPLRAKLDAADYVLENRGSLDDLQRQVHALHQQLSERFAVGEARS